MFYRFLIICFLTCFINGSLHAEDKTAYVICKNQKKVRTLRVQNAGGGKACETVYTKEGVSKVQGSGQSFAGCKKIMENIRANLEKSWWKCRDVTTTAQIVQ